MRSNLLLGLSLILLLVVTIFITVDTGSVAAPANKWSSELYGNGLWLYPENVNIVKAYKFSRLEGRIKDYSIAEDIVRVNLYNPQFSDFTTLEFPNEIATDHYSNTTIRQGSTQVASLRLESLATDFAPNTLVNLELVTTDIFSSRFEYLQRLVLYTINL
jgi:hypothetical protein